MGNRVKLALFLMQGATSLVLLAYGIHLPNPVPRIFSSLPMVITLAIGGFDRWAWHWPLIRKAVRRPWISGTWVGELTSYRRDPQTDAPLTSTHSVVLRIDQSLTSISATLMTAESKSRSIAAAFTPHSNGDYTLHYTYDNTPKLEYRNRSKIHRGSVAAEMSGPVPNSIESEYWTNRDTKGTIKLTRVSRSRADSFENGNKLATAKENTK